MKSKIITVVWALLVWAAVLMICFGLLCAAAAVPREKLADHLRASSDKLNELMPHQITSGSRYNSIADNYADAVLLGVAANMNGGSAVTAAIDTKYYDDGFGPAVGIRASLGDYPANRDYTRYWHGSLVFVRPMLAVTDIDGIRAVLAVITGVLFAVDTALLFLHRHTAAAVIFLAAALLTHFRFVFTTIEYMHTYIIMLAAVPLFVKFAENSSVLAVLSAAVGTVTAFADFLTTETLTLLVPLTLAFFVRSEKDERPDEKKSFMLLAACAVSWGTAYALTFIVKWAAASSVTGKSIADTALAAAGERVWDLTDGITSRPVMMLSALGANLTMLAPVSRKINIPAFLVWLVIFAAVCAFLGMRSKRTRTAPAALIVIAVLPVLRFCVLMNHSYLHNYFTYRALMAAIMAVLGFVWYKMRGGDTPKAVKTSKKKASGKKAAVRSDAK